MIRAYFLKPKKDNKEISETLFVGLARCIKDVPLEYISDGKTKVKAGKTYPCYQKEGSYFLVFNFGTRTKDAIIQNEKDFFEFFELGTNTEMPTPEQLPEGMVYCKEEQDDKFFKELFKEKRFYYINRKVDCKTYDIFSRTGEPTYCTKGDFLDCFVYPPLEESSETSPDSKKLPEFTIPKDLKIPDELKPAPKGDLYLCVKWDGKYFIEGEIYENQPQEIDEHDKEAGVVACFINENNHRNRFNVQELNTHFKAVI